MELTSFDTKNSGSLNDSGYVKIHRHTRDSQRKEYRPLMGGFNSKPSTRSKEEITMSNLQAETPSERAYRNNQQGYGLFQANNQYLKKARFMDDSRSSPGKYIGSGRIVSPKYEGLSFQLNGKQMNQFYRQSSPSSNVQDFFLKNKASKTSDSNFYKFNARQKRNSRLTANSNSKVSQSKASNGSYGSKYSKNSVMIPVDIECMSETQLRELKSKIDTKLTAKSHSRIGAGYANSNSNGRYQERESLNSMSKNLPVEDPDSNKNSRKTNQETISELDESNYKFASGSMSFKKQGKAMSLQKNYESRTF